MIAARLLAAILAGATATAALAPFNLVWLAPVAPLGLYLLLQGRSLRQAALTGFCFGLGFFGAGVSWVFVSISEHSATPLPVAVTLTALFVSGLALLFLLQGWLWRRFFTGPTAPYAFIGLWILGEWLRSWLFTGFPWLYLGYAALDTPLSVWAPIGGVWLNSLIFSASGILLLELIRNQSWRARSVMATLLLLPWLLLPVAERTWTSPSGAPIRVALVQANIDQAQKWNPHYRPQILSQYEALTLPHSGTELIIWPETAIPGLYDRAALYLNPLLDALDNSGSTLISGLPTVRRDSESGNQRFHNSLAVMSGGSGVYHKQRLVPFGEYLPMENYLRDLVAFFSLPMSSFSLPQTEQRPLEVKGVRLAAAICYEIAYPDLMRSAARDSDLILTVSNDTWFGHSIAPDQHMQIARFRALEAERWVIRGTNNGISGLIGPHGELVAEAPRFTPATLTGEVEPRRGATPFQQYGAWPVLLLSLGLCLPAFAGRRQSREPQR